MDPTDEWNIVLSSFHGLITVPENTVSSLTEILAIELVIHKHLEMNEDSMQQISNTINPNEHPVSLDMITVLSKYMTVLTRFSDYIKEPVENRETAYNKWLLPLATGDIIKDLYKGKFRGAIKYIGRDPKFIKPRISLKLVETKGIFPYNRIAIQDYDKQMSDIETRAFRRLFIETLSYDRIIRSRYADAMQDMIDINIKKKRQLKLI